MLGSEASFEDDQVLTGTSEMIVVLQRERTKFMEEVRHLKVSYDFSSL